jgi:AraC-like DNA-binding protein/mannose-6-phosphate isomerase-like protein (cupin superfamily)
MRFQSKTAKPGEFAPIELPADFPVSALQRDLRGEIAPIAPHVHDCFELGYCYEGSGIFAVENKVLPFRSGDAVVINHRELHVMQGQRETPARWDFINLRPSEMLAEYVCEEEAFLNTERLCGPGFQNIVSGQAHPDICAAIREIMTELSLRRAGYRSLVRTLVWMLLVKLHRLVPDTPPQQTYSRKKLQLIQPALAHIVARYGDCLNVEDLAGRCHTSSANFRKLFHAAVGMSPKDYIQKLRLKVASVMLTTTDRAIGEIALAAGYPTLSNFNRIFKNVYGISPREHRNKHHASEREGPVLSSR